MAIVRNEKRARELAEQAEAEQVEEQAEVDYTWRPTAEDYPMSVTVEDWQEMLKDPAIFDEEGTKVVECFFNYGSPATFQQLSVQYRGTMGRYRRWLNTAGERVGAHLGLEPPTVDRFGNPDWSGVICLSRPAGKLAAGMYEYKLRDEIEAALRRVKAQAQEAARAAELAAAKAQAKSEAEAKLAQARRKREAKAAAERVMADKAAAERARREREEKLAAMSVADVTDFDEALAPLGEKNAASEVRVRDAGAQVAAAQDAGVSASGVQAATMLPVSGKVAANELDELPSQAPAQAARLQGAVQNTLAPEALQAVAELAAALADEEQRLREEDMAAGSARVRRERRRPSERGMLDLASVYSRRLYDIFDQMAEGDPEISAARIARACGDESAAELQAYLNGENIPSFAYLDRLCATLGADARRLDVPEGTHQAWPVFTSLNLTWGAGLARALEARPVQEIWFVMDPHGRTLVVLGFGDLQKLLVSACAVDTHAKGEATQKFTRAAKLLHAWAMDAQVSVKTVDVDANTLDALTKGAIWPGAAVQLA